MQAFFQNTGDKPVHNPELDPRSFFFLGYKTYLGIPDQSSGVELADIVLQLGQQGYVCANPKNVVLIPIQQQKKNDPERGDGKSSVFSGLCVVFCPPLSIIARPGPGSRYVDHLLFKSLANGENK